MTYTKKERRFLSIGIPVAIAAVIIPGLLREQFSWGLAVGSVAGAAVCAVVMIIVIRVGKFKAFRD